MGQALLSWQFELPLSIATRFYNQSLFDTFNSDTIFKQNFEFVSFCFVDIVDGVSVVVAVAVAEVGRSWPLKLGVGVGGGC
ncbi:hypothetical protein Csa_021229 [Cucumis sativus]|uniref:Uncharacterized protein n=1 Tax=Cucumis sativus TaxID=3659 RepID=A0A0A0LGS1_CUCSA|nr:hypothetical protein Csa_021229 [Cucumis sativus]